MIFNYLFIDFRGFCIMPSRKILIIHFHNTITNRLLYQIHKDYSFEKFIFINCILYYNVFF
jgi:hypothetical protein